jgi:O-antigen/teichoic acid export membrane protein
MPEDSARRHLAGGAAISVIAQAAPLISGAVLSVVLARTIGPSGNGDYALLGTVLGITTLVMWLGLPAGLTYEVSRGAWSVRRALRVSYALALVLGIVASAAGFIFYLLTRHTVFVGVSTGVAVVVFASAPFFMQYQSASAIALGSDAYEIFGGLEVTHAAVILSVGAALAIPFGLAGAAVGLAGSGVVTAFVGWRGLHRRAPLLADTPDNVVLRRAFKFGTQSWVAVLLQQVNYRFDLIILGAFAATADVGIYSVALTITGIAWVLPQALQTVVFPRTASLDAAAATGTMAHQQADESAARAARHTVLLLAPAAVVVTLLLAVAVPLLYGRDFHDSFALGMIMLPGVLALGLGKVLMSIVIGRGYPRYALYSGLVTVPITLGLYFGLIPALGMWGAAIGSAISYSLTTVTIMVAFRHVTRIPLRNALVPGGEDLGDYRQAAGVLREWLRAQRHRTHSA